MFYALEGKITDKKNGFVVMNISGIHFTIIVSLLTYFNLKLGEKVKLFVELIASETGFRLYGFLNEEEKYLFNELRKISKIGAKTAISILSKFSPQEFKHIIANKKVEQLISVPGIGKKTASAIIFELSDKVLETDEKLIELLDVLTNSLGFSKDQVLPVLDKIYRQNPNLDTAELIKICLKNLRQ
ncbi:MAG: Holliday junction branch migration protein RuvA [Desulfurella sp.]|uniref:Holliday junction branch migration protein RuvA n=1 Tax=Desulfurella sp. TaxID=1962857 RepID=UPI000CAE15DF|nr:Holliday junction branch migration protein RuvA [Desulfurella sp.]PMP92616.1 MAG: Holliday junction branch migration protein RuvA [Desulfurella sp.]